MITALWLLACSGSDPASTKDEAPPKATSEAVDRGVALVYSHDLDGEIEPCG